MCESDHLDLVAMAHGVSHTVFRMTWLRLLHLWLKNGSQRQQSFIQDA